MIQALMKRSRALLCHLIVLIVMIAVPALAFPSRGQEGDNRPRSDRFATLYLFSGKGCPHCEREKKFLQTIKTKYPSLIIKEYEVWHDRNNTELFARVMKSAHVQSPGVPATIVGKKLFIGFSEETAKGVEDAVAFCSKQDCPDSLRAIATPEGQETAGERKKIQLPLHVELDPATMSLPLLTVIVGALDSFNPCAFFVLLFLLSMLIHAGSRKKMLLIGGIFVFFSGAIYFLFMAAWLNIFLIIGNLALITAAAGVIALLVASINIKDFFFFKRGLSLVIPEKSRTGLFARMRRLVRSSSLTGMIGGTAVLAVTANAYELLCTAGFPMLYTRTLTLHKLSTVQYYLYLVLYNIVYVVPLAVIVLIITISLGARKLTEWQGRQLKLVSGLMMLFLGTILLVNPNLLNNALSSIVLLGAVLAVSLITIYAAKKLRPKIAME